MIYLKFNKELGQYLLLSDTRLPNVFLDQINKFSFKKVDNKILYTIKDFSSTAYLLLNLYKTHPELCSFPEDVVKHLNDKSSVIDNPMITLEKDKKHIGISCPMLPFYLNLMKKIGGAEKTYTYYTIAMSRAFDIIRLLTNFKTFLPSFGVSDEVRNEILSSPLDKDRISHLYKTDLINLFSVHYAYKKDENNFYKAGYKTLSDLITNQPIRYIDKTHLTKEFSWKKNDPIIILGKILSKVDIKGQHASFQILVPGNHMTLDVIFFRRLWMLNQFNVGDSVLVMGNFYYGNRVSGTSMDSLVEANNIPIVPIYHQSQKNGITTKLLMSATHEALDRITPHKESFAPYFDKCGYLQIIEAFNELHFPTSTDNYKTALNALAFYELTYMQLVIKNRKLKEEKSKGLSKKRVSGKAFDGAINGFKWPLTEAQQQALLAIDKRLSSDSAEQILLSAEVGSGKTLIAQLTCLQAVDAGFQAVLAAPTEVLAQQLYSTFVDLLAGIPAQNRPTIVYLSGKTKNKDKKLILESIKYGETDIVVGTHSVISNKVKYKNLGVVCVDEQQKFGSAQREALLTSRDDKLVPDLLTQTATPIPRSTAQAFYGDIDIITMEGRPNGRKPVKTEWIKEDPTDIVNDKNNVIWKDMEAEAKLGHKTFIVVPMVYDNPKMSVSSVQATYKALKKNYPDLDIEYAHGQMKQDSQDKHMNHFRKKGDVLIASTVIEVGIDVPEATRMIVLSADRMGASSLHQIRGRVGRNDIPSKCYLISDNDSKQSQTRLQALVDTNNGFKIAQIDLKTRGEGDLFGLRQAGDSQFKFASLVDNSDLIAPAKELSDKIYNGAYRDLALMDAKYVLSLNKEEV